MLKIILAILIFSVIVIFHELGHFLLAKKSGVVVEEFAIGIGPTIIGKQFGETKYSIKCLPFGGCCMMKGEDGENAEPGSFNAAPVWGRFWTIFAGPLFNFILAFFMSVFMIGLVGADPSVISEVREDGAAQEAGLQAGDEIVKLGNSHVYNFREICLYNFMNTKDADVEVTYKRNGEKHTVTVTRKVDESGRYMLGVTSSGYQKQNIIGILKYSALEVRYQIKSTFLSLKYMISGRASVNDMSGPVGIVNIIGDTYTESVRYGAIAVITSLLSLSILLSANLGVMNLLPIPALDGGRLVFIILEMIRGKKINPEKEGMVHLAGMALLLAFMVFVMFNDIRKILF